MLYTHGREYERSAYMHKRGARGAAANRNAVIMDALAATVVQQHEGTRMRRRKERESDRDRATE